MIVFDIKDTVISLFKRRKGAVKNVGYYFLASFIPMLFNLILSPIYSLYLSAEDFAIIGYYTSFSGLLGPLIIFYMNQYYMREYYFRKVDERRLLRAMSFKALLVYPFLIMGLSLFGIYLYMHIFNPDSDIPFFPYALLSLLPLALAGVYRLELIDCKVQRRASNYFKISLCNTLILVTLSFMFIVVMKWGALGKMLGTVMPALILFIWSFFRHKDLLNESFDWKAFKTAVVFCIPLVAAAMMEFFSTGYDKVLLERYVDLKQLGIYSIGLTIASYLSVFSTAIGETFNPDIYESIANKNMKRALTFILVQIAIMAVIVVLFIVFAKYAIYLLTAGRYIESTPFARIASLASISTLTYVSVTPFILSAKKTKIVLYTKILGSIACVATYSFLIKEYGLYGVAWGYVICPLYFTVFSICFYWFSKRFTQIKIL